MKNKQNELREDADVELTKIKALKVLIKNNTLACTISIAGISIGLCDNSRALPLLEFQEQEIKKALNGKPNMWE